MAGEAGDAGAIGTCALPSMARATANTPVSNPSSADPMSTSEGRRRGSMASASADPPRPSSALHRGIPSVGTVVRVTLDFRIVGLGPDAVDYVEAWELQRQVHAQVAAGEQPPTVLLLEHPPVFTAGKRTAPHERPADPGGADVIDVDRGGK